MIPGFKNVGERFAAKNYHPVSLLSLVSKAFFSDSQYGFRSSRSTTDLLTNVSDRIDKGFNSFKATQAVALDISKASDSIWHAGLLHKLKFYGISGQIFGLISSFLSNR